MGGEGQSHTSGQYRRSQEAQQVAGEAPSEEERGQHGGGAGEDAQEAPPVEQVLLDHVLYPAPAALGGPGEVDAGVGQDGQVGLQGLAIIAATSALCPSSSPRMPTVQSWACKFRG